MNVYFGLQDKFCDVHDLENTCNGTEVPDDVLRFFGALFNFSHTDFKHPGSQAQSNDHDTERISLSRRRKIAALLQTLYYVIHNGHKRAPMHIMNAQPIQDTYKSITLIQSCNHLDLRIGYDEVRRYHTDMATLTAEKTAMMYQFQITYTETFTTAAFFIIKKQPYQELVAAMTQCQSYFKINQHILHKYPSANKAILQTGKETSSTIFL